jgi:hypothetical protein
VSQYTKWVGGLTEWTEDTTAFVSVVFSWQLAQAYQRVIWLKMQGYHMRAGGPAVTLNPHYLTDVAEIGGQVNALPHHNPDATFTSRGCIRKCPFCAVPRIEGDLVELDDWEPKPDVCDNNFLACSRKHFDKAIDRLKPVPSVDFTQGLDARLLTKYHAERLAELDMPKIRLAWDDVRLESQVAAAIQILKNALIPKRKIKVYVLFGFRDTPEDALYRMKTLKHEWGVNPLPMRYQPLDAVKRNNYVAPNWTDPELRRMQRYWWRTRWLGGIPFEEYKRDPATKPWLRRDKVT